MITIDSILISDEYTGNQNGGSDTGTTSLLGSIGDKEWAKITFEVHTETLNVPMTLTATTITRIDCPLGSFINDGWQVGQQVTIIGTGYYYATTATITAVTASVMTINQTIIDVGSFPSISIYDVTPILKMNFYQNTIGVQDGQSFRSLSDIRNTQLMSASWSINPSNVTMNPVGSSLAWYGGNVPIVNYVSTGGTGAINAYSRKYTIIAPFFIKPFVLAGQLTNLQNAKAGTPALPSPWLDSDCMTYLYQIDALYSTTNPTVNQSTGIQETPGNTGWFNEFLNGGIPVYTLGSIAYSNVNGTVSQIDPNNNTTVTIKINSVGNVINSSNSPFVVNFCKIPINQSSYQNTATNFRQDFIHDRCFTLTGAASKNGDQFGTSYQVITNCTSVLDPNPGGTQGIITFTVNLGSIAKAAFSTSTDANYLIWITPQNKTVTSLAITDRNAVICDVNYALINTDNSTLLTISTDATSDVHFFNSPDINVNPQTDFKGQQSEFSYLKCDFLVPVSTQINDINIKFQSVLYNTGIADNFNNIISTVDLETFLNNTISSFDGHTNNINVSVPTNFPVPSTDPRSAKSIQRKSSLDGSGLLGYEILYGFQVGYAYFQNVPNGVGEFQNVGTRLWSGYWNTSAFNGGTLPSSTAVRTDLLITWDILDPATNIVTQFNRRCAISPGDSGMNSSTVSSIVSTSDLSGNNLNGAIANDQLTQINVEFFQNPYSGVFPTPPMGYSFRGNISIWYNNGTVQTLDVSDSNYALTSTSLWMNNTTVDNSVLGQVNLSAVFNGVGQQITIYRIVANLSYQHN